MAEGWWLRGAKALYAMFGVRLCEVEDGCSERCCHSESSAWEGPEPPHALGESTIKAIMDFVGTEGVPPCRLAGTCSTETCKCAWFGHEPRSNVAQASHGPPHGQVVVGDEPPTLSQGSDVPSSVGSSVSDPYCHGVGARGGVEKHAKKKRRYEVVNRPHGSAKAPGKMAAKKVCLEAVMKCTKRYCCKSSCLDQVCDQEILKLRRKLYYHDGGQVPRPEKEIRSRLLSSFGQWGVTNAEGRVSSQ